MNNLKTIRRTSLVSLKNAHECNTDNTLKKTMKEHIYKIAEIKIKKIQNINMIEIAIKKYLGRVESMRKTWENFIFFRWIMWNLSNYIKLRSSQSNEENCALLLIHWNSFQLDIFFMVKKKNNLNFIEKREITKTTTTTKTKSNHNFDCNALYFTHWTICGF